MTLPSPALVTQRAAQRMPRVALTLLCAAYLLPGLFGRDPWKNADVSAFGAMLSIAEGRSSWLAPSLGGLTVDGGLLPYWLGAVFIRALSPFVDPAFAARWPFMLMLAATLALVWSATAHLARTEAAQPVPFAFGGEAPSVDYSRAMADGALLALMASLGLLQLGHETTPELAQLVATALFLWALAAAPYRRRSSRIAVIVSLSAAAASGAPSIAVGLGVVGTIVCLRSSYSPARRLAPWIAVGTLAAAVVAWLAGSWALRLGLHLDAYQASQLARLLLWFCWPVGPLALWTLWRWRRHLTHRHISAPLVTALVALVACVAMGGSTRALMLALPGLAVLAAFSLPTLKRSTSAALDWFSICFFTLAAATVWVFYASMMTGVPAKPGANVAKLAPGFAPTFSLVALIAAAAGSLAWIALVRWRTSRNRHAIWKSLLLPAGGVALCWLLAMTLWLPALDYARSYRPLVARIAFHVPEGSCIAAAGITRAQIAALEVFGRYRVDAVTVPGPSRCAYLVAPGAAAAPAPAPGAGWSLVARVSRPTDRYEILAVFRR